MMGKVTKRALKKSMQVVLAVSFGCAASAFAETQAAKIPGEALVKSKCGACHGQLIDGKLQRISSSRKTPEGWDMTVARMTLIHGVSLSAEERMALVKSLSDTQGLAPSESKGWRYVLERRPNVVEKFEDRKIGEICARCHSYARIALQRRSEDDWLKLSHFHVGQFPSIELQASGRDRNWWEIASIEIPKLLANTYPLSTDAWKTWEKRPKADLSGKWRVTGHQPGVGNYEGVATISRADDDQYKVSVTLSYIDGKTLKGEGSAMVYTGHEWRASVKQDDEDVRQVLSVSEDGNHMAGRWFLEKTDAIGGDMRATRISDSGAGEVMAVYPEYIKSGATAKVAIYGVNLKGPVSLGNGVQVLKVVSQNDSTVIVEAKAGANVEAGAGKIQVGDAVSDVVLTVYKKVDSVRIEPGNAIARVGDGGGPIGKVPTQFEAIGYLNGPDRRPGTADDVRIGVMPAKWRIGNLNKNAENMRDANFVGKMDAKGLFIPAAAGPNPKRKYSTNNAGEIKVTAEVNDGGRPVKGEGELMVTVQRWNDPPIH